MGNIYLLQHFEINGIVGRGYWRFIIVAPDEETARNEAAHRDRGIAPNANIFDLDRFPDKTEDWLNEEKTSCELIGVAKGRFERGITSLAYEYNYGDKHD